MNALPNLFLPCCLSLFVNVWLHADKQLPRKDQTLIACEYKRISGNSIKRGRHE